MTFAPSDFRACNCSALRRAARRMTQFYDQFLVPAGLRTTQFPILAKLRSAGPMTINALAEMLVMDRTTLGRNLQPLEREGLVAVRQGKTDRRTKELYLTDAGAERFAAADQGWRQAQAAFETTFGTERAVALRGLLDAVVAADLPEAN